MISAEIGKDVVTQTRDRSVILAADLDCADLGAAMNCRLHVFAARLDPFHRLAELDRDPGEQRLFRVNIQLRTETAADLRRDHAQLVFREPNH